MRNTLMDAGAFLLGVGGGLAAGWVIDLGLFFALIAQRSIPEAAFWVVMGAAPIAAIVPFAWFISRQGGRRVAAGLCVGAVLMSVLWLLTMRQMTEAR